MAGTESREDSVNLTGKPKWKSQMLSCKGKLRVVGVQKVRWSGKDKIRHNSWTFIYSGRDDQKHEAGVGVLLSKRAADAVNSTDCISERLLKIRFKAGVTNLTVIVGYAQTEVANTPEKDELYDQLNNILGNIPRHDMCLLIGDFNARVGKDITAYPRVIGQHGMGDMNENGQRLLDTCSTHGLAIAGTIFQHKEIHKYTWTSNTVSRTRAQLDHIIVNSRWKRSMTDCRTYRGADIFSDHELLISTITMKLAKPKSRGAKGKFATYKLNDQIMKERYQQEVKKHLIEENSQQLEIEEDWDNIKKWNSTCCRKHHW
ncbi:craniofacial development protein 2-like [Ostrea edulis]|uniref:craniofacial development protein 2-like n=1 Tax=Ostrea edulis TaxID=37623 RepID=UPI0024AEFA4D|nr:craniofacial development protein 2-like [Ostrea edulis]